MPKTLPKFQLETTWTNSQREKLKKSKTALVENTSSSLVSILESPRNPMKNCIKRIEEDVIPKLHSQSGLTIVSGLVK